MNTNIDTSVINLQQLSLVVWLINVMQNAPEAGFTLAEIQAQWKDSSQKHEKLTRPRFDRHRLYAQLIFGVQIECPDRKHYHITNPDKLPLSTLTNDLLASVQEYLLVDEFRDLGARLQPAQIIAGRQYLTTIARAIRENRKIEVVYQKFTDSQPYTATLHPYILKAIMGRWYILAHKEDSTHTEVPAQMFALDRTLSVRLLDTHFRMNPQVNPRTYFNKFYGAYVNEHQYPVRDIIIACTPQVAPYLRTLPLHHSQKELTGKKKAKLIAENNYEQCTLHSELFSFHLSPSPDFLGALQQWGDSLIVLE